MKFIGVVNVKKLLYIESKWVNFIFVISIISTLVSLYEVNNSNYSLMWSLPTTYCVLTLIFRKIYERPTYDYGIGFWFINIALMARYAITPIAIVFTNVYGRLGPTPSSEYFTKAYLLMIYEMVGIFLTIRLMTLLLKNKTKKKKENEFFNGNYVVIGVFLALAFVILMKYPGSIIPSNLFVISTEGGESLSQFQSNGTINTLRIAFKMTFFLTVVSIFNERYKKDNRIIWAFMSLGLLFMFLGSLTGSSRWGIIFNSVIGTYILLELYPKVKYIILISIITLVVVSFISISIYKFYYILGDSENQVSGVIEKMLTMFEDYFSGPRLVAQSIEMTKIYSRQINSETLLNELVVPIPFIHKLLPNPENMCNLYFNCYNLGNPETCWLIIPMVGQGYSIFGFIFAPIFTVTCEAISLFFDSCASKTSAYELKYLFLYTSIWGAVCVGLCTQIIFTWIMSSFITIYILYKLNRMICL